MSAQCGWHAREWLNDAAPSLLEPTLHRWHGSPARGRRARRKDVSPDTSPNACLPCADSSSLLLGIAFAIAEECIILQTSVSPPYQRLLFGSAPNASYLGAFGVNWAYLLWAVGYESVWGIMLPIQLTELIFPAWRDDPWLGRWGLVITAIIFLLPSFGIW
jgi:hypothetical protein